MWRHVRLPVRPLGEIQARDIDLYMNQRALDTSTPAGRMLGVFSRLVRTLNANYVGAALGWRPGGTSERDALFDVLGLHFTGRQWPHSGGTEATRRYLADLQHGMIADSFAVTE